MHTAFVPSIVPLSSPLSYRLRTVHCTTFVTFIVPLSFYQIFSITCLSINSQFSQFSQPSHPTHPSQPRSARRCEQHESLARAVCDQRTSVKKTIIRACEVLYVTRFVREYRGVAVGAPVEGVWDYRRPRMRLIRAVTSETLTAVSPFTSQASVSMGVMPKMQLIKAVTSLTFTSMSAFTSPRSAPVSR